MKKNKTQAEKEYRQEDGQKKAPKKVSFARILLQILLVAVLGCIGGAGVASVDVFQRYDCYLGEKAALRSMYKNIQTTYSIYVVQDVAGDCRASELGSSNFRYGVLTTEDFDQVDLSDPANYLYTNFTKEELGSLQKGSADLNVFSCNYGENTVSNAVLMPVDLPWMNNSYLYNPNYTVTSSATLDEILCEPKTGRLYVRVEDYILPVSLYLHVSEQEFYHSYEDKTDSFQILEDGSVVFPANTADLLSDRSAWTDPDTRIALAAQGEWPNGWRMDLRLEDVELVTAEDLKQWKDGTQQFFSWQIDGVTGNIRLESDQVRDYPAYYVISKVREPLDPDSDDLFVSAGAWAHASSILCYVCPILGFLFLLAAAVLFVQLLWWFVRWALRLCRKGVLAWAEHRSLLWRSILIIGGICFLELIFVLVWGEYEAVAFLFVVEKIVLIPLLLICIVQIARLQKTSSAMAAGDLSQTIDTRKMFFDLKTIGRNLNSLGNGIELAVKDRMKSEHFQTELIANVSHDIKTPLTSIISYSELLRGHLAGQAEAGQNAADETTMEYLDVLQKQSSRLKTLLENLIEASKATTGNVTAELLPCNISMALSQVLGEYEDRLQAAQLDLKIKLPEEHISILADSRHLQRIFDNLILNMAKHGQPGTRAYVNLEKEGDLARISFKNTSRTELNLSAEELMQRFVQGDTSRGEEGHGLGLSIAKSLTELMGGSLDLVIDGDLFRVDLRFPCLKEASSAPAPVSAPLEAAGPSTDPKE